MFSLTATLLSFIVVIWSHTAQVIPLTEFYEQKISTLTFERFEYHSC